MRVDDDKIVLIGHSLGGNFVMYYLLQSYEEEKLQISNFIAASPPVEADTMLLFKLERRLKIGKSIPFTLYASRGSMDVDSASGKNYLNEFGEQMREHQYPGAKTRFVEYGNFEHMDAATPGFVKGLIFIFSQPPN